MYRGQSPIFPGDEKQIGIDKMSRNFARLRQSKKDYRIPRECHTE